MNDYTGKIVYIGIDVHKKTYAVSCICENILVKKDTLAAYPEVLLSYIHKYFANATVYTAYEAGFSGFHLHRYLTGNQVKNIVVHPGGIEVASRDRVKTDKRDSLKLARLLSDGRLKAIHVPSEQREQFRAITRIREALMDQRRRIGNQLKSLLFTQGLIKPADDTIIGKMWIKRMLIQDMAPDIVKARINSIVKAQEWLDLTKKIKDVKQKLKEQAQADQKIDMVYRAVPGIGALSARVLSNELDDMAQFHSGKGIFSCTGLTPSEYSSGEHRRQGNISRQGRSILRKTLVQVAWVTIKHDEHLRLVFERISQKAGKKRAIVAIARKLIGCIRSTFITGEVYEINRGLMVEGT